MPEVPGEISRAIGKEILRAPGTLEGAAERVVGEVVEHVKQASDHVAETLHLKPKVKEGIPSMAASFGPKAVWAIDEKVLGYTADALLEALKAAESHPGTPISVTLHAVAGGHEFAPIYLSGNWQSLAANPTREAALAMLKQSQASSYPFLGPTSVQSLPTFGNEFRYYLEVKTERIVGPGGVETFYRRPISDYGKNFEPQPHPPGDQ